MSETRVAILEANIDDMLPQHCEPVAESLFAAGAVDVFWTPIIMKKGRPALLLTAICPLDLQETVAVAIFKNSSTIGIRTRETDRFTLERTWITVVTKFGPVRMKVGSWKGEIVNAQPEFEDVKSISKASNTPVKIVHAAAIAAYIALEKAD